MGAHAVAGGEVFAGGRRWDFDNGENSQILFAERGGAWPTMSAELRVQESQTRDNLDAKWIARIAARDQRAFAELYDQYAGLIYTLIFRIVRNASDAEELLEDVFWQLWQKPDRFDANRGSLQAFLVMVARSRSIDRLRSRASRRGDSTSESSIDDLNRSDPRGGPESLASKNEEHQKVKAALLALDPHRRKLIEQSFYDGKTHSEIAAQMQRPLGTIKSEIRRGLLELKESLDDLSQTGR